MGAARHTVRAAECTAAMIDTMPENGASLEAERATACATTSAEKKGGRAIQAGTVVRRATGGGMNRTAIREWSDAMCRDVIGIKGWRRGP